jgi:hypothetical protein
MLRIDAATGGRIMTISVLWDSGLKRHYAVTHYAGAKANEVFHVTATAGESLEQLKQRAQAEARRRGIDHVENLDSPSFK